MKKLILLLVLSVLLSFSCDNDTDGKCTKKEDCKTGEVCNADGKCEVESIKDCTKENCYSGYQCNTETKKCEKIETEDCTKNACPAGETCNPVTKKCEGGGNTGMPCNNYNSCMSETEYCVGGHCTNKPLLINEYMVKNDKFTDFKNSAWVEIYNTTDKAINLADYYICNRLQSTHTPDPESCTQIPNTSSGETTVATKGFIIFYYDDETGALHIKNERIEHMDGSVALYLLKPDKKTLIDDVSQVSIVGDANNKLQKNISSGRIDQGETWGKMTSPTPGAANEGGVSWDHL